MKQLKITKQITNRENESLERYLQDISKIPLITTETEVELAVRIRAGDHVALEKLARGKFAFRGVGCKTVPKSRTYAK